MTRSPLVRAALLLVPAAWRAAVGRDLDEEASAQERGTVWLAWQAVRVGVRLRRTVGWDALRSDLSGSIRSLLRAKGFTAAAVMTFTLGIGANVAVFSVIDRLMFRPLPYAEPERLVQLHSTSSIASSPEARLDVMIAQRIIEGSRTLDELAYADGANTGRAIDGFGTAPVVGALATANLLKVLGVHPVAGRDFTPDDSRSDDGPREILLTYDTWRARFGGALDVMDRVLGSGGSTYRVVGVLPQDFVLPSSALGERTNFVAVWASQLAGPVRTRPGYVITAPIARLRQGVSHAQATAEIDTLVAPLREQFPDSAYGFRVALLPLQQGLFFLYAPYLWLIVGAASLVLLVACVNLATLLLARGRSRAQEAAVRTALGASLGRLMVGAALDATALCMASSVAALFVCQWARSTLMVVVPPQFRSFAVPAFDSRLIGLTLVAAFGSALLATLGPAVSLRRIDVLSMLQRGSQSGAAPRQRGGAVLLALEAALGVVLVAGAATTVHSFLGLALRDPGFVADNLYVLTLGFVPDPSRPAESRLAQVRATRQALAETNGIRAAGVITRSPLGEEMSQRMFWRERGLDGGEFGISEGVFEAMGTPMRFGRSFTATEVDTQGLVAILNERGARALWPGEPIDRAVGRFIDTKGGRREVVGIVADTRSRPGAQPVPALFLPATAVEASGVWLGGSLVALVRMWPGSEPDRGHIAYRLRETLGRASVSSTPAISVLAPWLERPRFQALLFGSFAVIGLLLAAVGIYAVSAFEVARRRHEMGVRMTLGASGGDIRRLLVRGAVLPVAVGAVAGLALTWWAARFLQSLLFEVNARDPWTFAAVAIVLVATAVAASWLPARRAARLDPATVLRAT